MSEEPISCPWCDVKPKFNYVRGVKTRRCSVVCDNEDCPVRPHVSGKIYGDSFLEAKASAIMLWNTRKEPKP